MRRQEAGNPILQIKIVTSKYDSGDMVFLQALPLIDYVAAAQLSLEPVSKKIIFIFDKPMDHPAVGDFLHLIYDDKTFMILITPRNNAGKCTARVSVYKSMTVAFLSMWEISRFADFFEAPQKADFPRED